MRNLTGIRVVSFDGDGTLWDFEKVMRHSLQQVLLELKHLDFQAASRLNIEKMIEIRMKVGESLRGKVTNLEKLRLEAFRQTLKEVGRPNNELALHLNQVYLKHRFEDVELYDEVISTLEELKDKHIIGLLSNGNSYPERCGLEDVFQFVVFSQDYGVEKPDPGIFKIVLDKTGRSAEELLHVGDSVEDDVKGAINSGARYLWLNRTGKERPSVVEPEYEISSLTELLTILDRSIRG